ncbi:MAG: methyltransferase domain-containing protein [Patescibacteria group bacterium]|nr:methyltransferase domain-containing protein [Patescibacteria group bacterium]
MSLSYHDKEGVIFSRLEVAHNPAIAKIRGEFFEIENKFLRNYIQNEKVLVAGSGLGHDALELAKNNLEVVGVELLEALVIYSNKKAIEADFKNLKFICGDINKLPFKDNFFDSCVLNMGTIGNFDNKKEIINELLRVSNKLYFDFYPPTKKGLERRKEMYTQEGWENVLIMDNALVSDDGLYSKSINKSDIQKIANDLKADISFYTLNDFAVMAVLRSGDAPVFKMETIKGPNNSEVSFCPERGGIISSLKLKGKEVLYMDNDSFKDTQKNVRGGIPILFPNAGPVEDSRYKLKQHGFARTSDKWKADNNIEKLVADKKTMEAYPYNFSLEIKNDIEEDGSVLLSQEVTNLESNKDLPLAMGLHPYFRVPTDKKKDIKFNFIGGDIIENDVKNWSNDGTTSIENPKIKNPDEVLRIEIPDLGTLIMDVSQEYNRIWVWSQPGKDFICIEPAMREEGGLVNEPEMIKSGQKFSGKVKFSLE